MTIRRRWWLVLLPFVVVAGLSYGDFSVLLNPPSRYLVEMRFSAAAPAQPASPTSETYEDSLYVPWLASEYVVVNFPQWITSDSFAHEVSAVLAGDGIVIGAENLRPAFAADSARSILIVHIYWLDAEELAAIAQAASLVLKTRNQPYFPQFSASPAQVVALDDVHVRQLPLSFAIRFGVLVKLAVGLAGGLALAAAAEYVDDSVRSAYELSAMGLIVLGNIPGE